MLVENGSEPTWKDVMLSLASIKNMVDGINNRICSVEEGLCKVEENLCKVGELEIKAVSLEESQDFLSKRYEEQDKNIEDCIELAHQVCKLAAVEIKKKK